jgi:hypothetical protein
MENQIKNVNPLKINKQYRNESSVYKFAWTITHIS